MVSLNPGMALHLDKRLGSIKVGKDGDVVLWSDHPLSIYAKVEKTIIEGVVYFDREKDKQLREEILRERARLIQKMLAEKSGGEKTQKPMMKKPKHYHCETLEDYGSFYEDEDIHQDSEH
jgi:urease alpha subunit